MKIAYINPVGGISGDMLVGALLDGGGDEQQLLDELKKLSLPGWKWQRKEEKRRGFGGTKIDFLIEKGAGEPERHLFEISQIIKDARFPKEAERIILTTFFLLAEAEAKTHQADKEHIHFHEIGATDTILDICAVALLLHSLKIEKIHCSPLPMGSGSVHCAHGEIPLPAPALNELLCGVPVFGSETKGETVTPTGIALLKALSCQFSNFPAMTISGTGVGLGSRDSDVPNLLRIFIGESGGESLPAFYRMECTVDDMTGEDLCFLWDVIYAAGANEIYFTPIYMKKGRPGIKITVLTEGENLEKIRGALFTHTSTLGMIATAVERFPLKRHFQKVITPYGEVTYKCAEGYGVNKAKAEYEDLKKIAEATGLPLAEIRKIADDAKIREHDND